MGTRKIKREYIDYKLHFDISHIPFSNLTFFFGDCQTDPSNIT